LSLTLPPAQGVHTGHVVATWLDNLLPESRRVRERWASRFGVRPHPYTLLAYVGMDCAGAVQFIPEDRLNELSSGRLEPMDTATIAARLRALREDPAAWSPDQPDGQRFSLAGTQSKFALRQDDDRWYEAYGAEPTSHIIKPSMLRMVHQPLNEHLCQRTATLMGFSAARTRVQCFDEQQAIVVTRYDRRVSRAGRLRRLHQEDLCQALGLAPDRKYPREKGLGPQQIAGAILDATGSPDEIVRFLDVQALFWALGAIDGHLKNFSLLWHGNRARLAPLYDVNSVFPYMEGEGGGTGRIWKPSDARLALGIGGRNQLHQIDGHAWRKLSAAYDVNADELLARVENILIRTPQALAEACHEEIISGRLNDDECRFAEQFAGAVNAHDRHYRDALHSGYRRGGPAAT
jgi:serine/threonine-protein kinase HipA